MVSRRESKSSHRTQNIDISYNYKDSIRRQRDATRNNAWLSKRCVQTLPRASLMKFTLFLAHRMAIPRLTRLTSAWLSTVVC